MAQPPNPPPVIRAPYTPGICRRRFDQLVERGDRNPEVLGQAAVPLGHDCSDGTKIAAAEEALDFAHPCALGDHVPTPPA